MRIKRPRVVEAYMTHASTPWITELLADGRTRKVARIQYVGSARELQELLATYGERWTGVRQVRLSAGM
jgi:hypothetical protein